jgi:hypothetical protein
MVKYDSTWLNLLVLLICFFLQDKRYDMAHTFIEQAAFMCKRSFNGVFFNKFAWNCNVLIIKAKQQDALILNFILVKNSTCFEQIYCPSSGVLILYSQQLVFVTLVVLTVWLAGTS